MNINKKVVTAIIFAAVTIASLAGCSSATKATPAAPKPTASASAASTKTASADEVKAKTLHVAVDTAAGTFNACSDWITVSNGESTQHTVYTKGDFCEILPPLTTFKSGDNAIACNPKEDGTAAVGIVFKNGDTAATSTYECTYTVPVAGQ